MTNMHPLPPKKKKLKKYQVFLLVLIAFIFSVLLLARITDGLQYFSIPTGSNEPTINVGDYIFSTNLKDPKRFDFICYRMNDSLSGRQIWVHRLCGLPGDRIEIRNDTLFVNGENVDQQFNLQKTFVIPTIDPDQYGLNMEKLSPIGNGDSLMATLQTIKDSALIKRGHLYIENTDPAGDPHIRNVYQQPWTPSNFGPYIVPIGKYFVLGDNRLFSMDSRYNGPLDVKQYFGTVIGRK